MRKPYLFLFACCLGYSITAAAQLHGNLLVANKGDHTLSIFDIPTQKQVALLPVGEAPHELAVSADGKTAVVCNYGAAVPGNTLTVINIAARKKVRTISTGIYTRPHGIEFISPNEVIVTSETTRNLLQVNITTGKIDLVIPTEQERSHMVAWSASDRMAYVSNINSGTVSAISLVEKKVLKQVSLSKGIEGIAVSPDGKELWVANRDDSTVTALNTKTWETIAVMPAHAVAYRVKFLPDGQFAMVSNGSAGNMSVYNVQQHKRVRDIDFRVLQYNAQPDANGAMPVQAVPGGITVSEGSRYVFVSVTGYKLAAKIDVKDWRISGYFLTGNVPDGIYYAR